MLELRSVSFAYSAPASGSRVPGPPMAISSLSASFEPGQLIAIAGPNGSGKSTLLRLLARVLAPTAGTVLLQDKELREWDPRAYARIVGYLPQDVDTTFPMKALDVVLSGRAPYLRRFQWETGEDILRAQEALQACDALGLADRFLDEMSGGERKRVFLARVLAGSPDLILLDEPFAALDLNHIQQLLLLLRRLVAESGRSVIFVSHDLNWSGAYSDRMLVMTGGSVVADGPPAAILTPELLASVFGVTTEAVSVAGNGRRWIVPRV